MTRKSCITCAYNAGGKKELYEVYSDKRWCGYTAECQRQMWTVEYTGGWYREEPIDELAKIYPENFGLTKIPILGHKWHDLAKYKCRHYYPERKRGTMSREKCWEEHQQRKERIRFIITTGLSIIVAVAVVLTAIFHLIELLGVES